MAGRGRHVILIMKKRMRKSVKMRLELIDEQGDGYRDGG